MPYTIHDVLAAYVTAPTPLLQEAVARWLAQFVSENGMADHDPDALRAAHRITLERAYAEMHPPRLDEEESHA